jgi:hypothetical protein
LHIPRVLPESLPCLALPCLALPCLAFSCHLSTQNLSRVSIFRSQRHETLLMPDGEHRVRFACNATSRLQTLLLQTSPVHRPLTLHLEAELAEPLPRRALLFTHMPVLAISHQPRTSSPTPTCSDMGASITGSFFPVPLKKKKRNNDPWF